MEEKQAEAPIIHSFEGEKQKMNTSKKTLLIIFVMVVFLGIGSGYFASRVTGGGSITSRTSTGGGSGQTLKKGDIFGSTDSKTFKDSVEGELKAGGVDGEGAFHLERSGGESQNVYMTSSVIDLEPFVGKKVKVWGETHAAEKAGWLMDVGRLQLLD